MINEIAILYRPVGPKKLELIRQSGYRAFPPRLPEQRIFYPVLTEAYAHQIARDWNVTASGAGYVTRFAVRTDFVNRYAVQVVGNSEHKELWIPGEDLEDLNRNIVGENRSDRRVHIGADPMNTIKFYRIAEPYGEFSNFAAFPIKIDGKTWPTSEHFFQGQKFPQSEHQNEIRRAKSPMIAARLGRSRRHPIRRDWEAVKDDIMREALRAKFTQHPELRSLLLSTGDARLIEHTTNDAYWGDGGDGSGKNRLGLLLMELRESLRKEIQA